MVRLLSASIMTVMRPNSSWVTGLGRWCDPDLGDLLVESGNHCWWENLPKQTPTQFHIWMFYFCIFLPCLLSAQDFGPNLNIFTMTRWLGLVKCEKGKFFQDANSIQLMSASYTINRHRITRDWKAVVTATILISFCQPGLLRSNVAPSPRTLK